MLILLPNKQIAEQWDLFKDTLRSSVPITKDMLPNWLNECLYSALCGRINCWIAVDQRAGTKEKRDRAYGAMITKPVVDEISGQRALLIYALKMYHMASRETRKEDIDNLARWAASNGYNRMTAYCNSRVVANLIKKAYPKAHEIVFSSITLEDYMEN